MRRSRLRRRSNRGSALLVSLMVIVGLSLLGLGFVAISETESAIAKNEENALQTQSVAEAGAMVVVEWFQNPQWGRTNAAMPGNTVALNPNLTADKPLRYVGNNATCGSGSPGNCDYVGRYKDNTSGDLFDKPYRPNFVDRFYGTDDNPDVIINRTTDSTTIDNFNNVLLGTNPEDRLGGEVTEIKVYAPPMVGATINSAGFYTGGSRYGLATIKVTAQQFRNPFGNKTAPGNILASHSVRLVIGEIPLPIPGGPIQSNTAIAFNGDFIVHWGNETSTGDLKNKRDAQVIPWANAFEHLHYEHGYEPGSTVSSVTVTNGGSGYTAAQNNAPITIAAPCCGGTQATATMQVSAGSVTGVTITGRGTKYVSVPGQLGWGPVVTFPAPGSPGTTATGIATVGSEAWPVSGAQFEDASYFQEVLGKTFDDPWFGSRAVGSSNGPGCSGVPQTFGPPLNAQCTPYSYTSQEGSNDESHFFEWQSVNLYPWQKIVLFPKIVYAFWKKVTKQSRGLKGMYYFAYDGAGGFKRNGSGASQGMCAWVNSQPAGALGPGVYFFDTANGLDPQNGGPGTLTPAEGWGSACMNPSFLMTGFIYMNAQEFGTQGVGSTETLVPNAAFPGEPFRDIGYPRWNTTLNDWDKSCGENPAGANNGQICRLGVGDGTFSYQDLNGNGQFDVVTMPAPAWNSYDPGATGHAAGSTYIVKTWKSNAQAIADYGAACTLPGTNPATDCSEPHEPYLNYIYPGTPGSVPRANAITVGWEANNAQTRLPKKVGVTCTAASPPDDCTSNGPDVDGAIVSDMLSILDGVAYNEGNFNSQGNADYFGSLLIQGTVLGTGTPDIWFDEKLVKGTWAPPGMPRVMIFSEQTDEMSQQ